MPVSITKTTQSGQIYETVFTGPIDHTVEIPVPLSALTANEIDDYGYLRPGVPLTKAGALVGASPAFVYGVTIEAIKVAADNASATIAALGTVWIAVAVYGCVRQKTAEDQLERAYTANEIAGFDRAGSKLVLV